MGCGVWSVAEGATPHAAHMTPGGLGSGSGAALAVALFQAEAVAVHLQDVNMVGQPVEEGSSESS